MQVVPIGAACGAALLLTAVLQGPKPAPAAPKVAVVNPYRVQKESKWAASLLIAVNEEAQQNLEKLKKLEGELKKKRKELSLWEKGSREYDQVSLEVGVLETRLQNMANMFGAWHERRRAEAYLAIRDEIERQIQDLAKQRKIDLVLKLTEISEKANAVQRVVALQGQSVLYADPALDLTRDVIRLLDAAHAGSQDPPKTGKSPGEAGSPKR